MLSKIFAVAIIAAALTSPSAAAEAADPPSMRVLPGITRAVSPHVWVIPSEGRSAVPNVGIVVGAKAALVIDSGLGEASGAVVRSEVARIAPGSMIYVVATHYHPEHIGGEQAFADATILRPAAQQREVVSSGEQMIGVFRRMSADNQALLKDFAFQPAALLFDGAITIDLGGVTVELFPAGPAHTDGDLAILVHGDGVLFTGDVVQQNYAPVLMGERSSIASWLGQVERLAAQPATIIVPSHSAVTSRAAFADMRQTLEYVRDQWAALRARGTSIEEATQQLVAAFKRQYPQCRNADLLRLSVARLDAR